MLDFATDVARRAGTLLLEALDRQRRVELKGAFNLVTDADHASEELIVAAITQQFPGHAILAEEGGGVERVSEYTWLIDPLDGTNNYAHGFPFFSVSLALLKGRAPVLGVVFDPVRDEMFTAEAGQGARRNGRPIRVSQTATLAAALVSTGFPYDYGAVSENNARQFARIQACCQGVRRVGSAALDLAYVAMGRLDAHWELRLAPWDAGAGALLVTEAGGQISDWRGGPWHPWSERLLASNGHIHAELIRVLEAV